MPSLTQRKRGDSVKSGRETFVECADLGFRRVGRARGGLAQQAE